MPSGPTIQQRKFAELLVKGEHTIVDAYVIAYQVPEEEQVDRAALSNRAYSASKGKAVAAYIQKLQEQMAVEEARMLVWDKRKSAERLMKVIHEVEVNVDITRKLRDEAVNEPSMMVSKKLDQMLKVAQIDNDTMRLVKECIQELNGMYGLTSPGVSLQNAVTVIIGSPEQMPDDEVDTVAPVDVASVESSESKPEKP
jgi:glutamyl/glutaminyl-tRNA synthetase